MGLWATLANMGTLATLYEFFCDITEKGISLHKSASRTREFQEIIDYSKLAQDIHYSADVLDQYLFQHQMSFAGNTFFDKESRNEFCQTFFNKHPDLINNKKELLPLLEEYLNRLEIVLSMELSLPEKALLHTEIDNNKLLKEIILILSKVEDYLNSKSSRYDVHKNDNLRYSSSFCDTLFLHRGRNDKVNLQNLFVLQNYLKSNGGKFERTGNGLEEELELFLNGSNIAMYIEGDGGSGKSTLVSWLCYHYCIKDSLAKKLFGNRTLFTIRLRELDREIIQKKRLILAILTYLGFATIGEMVKAFPDSIIVLDGFDELCMIEGVSDYEIMLGDLFRKNLPNYQFIITTRPKYINYDSSSLNVPSVRIHLEHFNKKQTEEWIHKYKDICNESVSTDVVDYLLRHGDEDEYIICDTPLTLYMIMAKNVPNDSFSNQWALYYDIFAQELSETEYNSMIPNDQWNYSHPIYEYRDLLYEISEEIAYIMYRSGNKQLYVSESDIKTIVSQLIHKDIDPFALKNISERSYALCAYWKADARAGFVEFYHNNVRDFFLAEWIYRQFNQVFEGYYLNLYSIPENTEPGNNNTSIRLFKSAEECLNRIIEIINERFQYAPLTRQVCKFIYLRAKYKTDNKATVNSEEPYEQLAESDFPLPALKSGFTYSILNSLFTTGAVQPKVYGTNPIRSIINVILCCAQIFRYSAEPFIKVEQSTLQRLLIDSVGTNLVKQDREYYFRSINHLSREEIFFKWWNNVNSVNQSGLFSYIFRTLFFGQEITIDGNTISLLDKSDLTGCDLSNCDLRGIQFNYCNLNGVHHKDAIVDDDFFDFIQVIVSRFEQLHAEGKREEAYGYLMTCYNHIGDHCRTRSPFLLYPDNILVAVPPFYF